MWGDDISRQGPHESSLSSLAGHIVLTVHTLEGEGRGALAPRSAIWSKVAPPPSGGQATVRREGGALPSTAVVAGCAESIHGYARSSRGGT